MAAVAMPARRLVARNTVSQLATYAFGWGTKAAAGVLVARALGPRGMGEFTLMWTVASMLAFFAPLGLTTLLVRELNRRRGPETLAIAFPLAVVLGLVFAGALGCVAFFVGSAALGVAAAYVALAPAALVMRSIFHARERMELETAVTSVEGVVGLSVAAAAVAAGYGVAGALGGLVVGLAANIAVAAVLVRNLGVEGRLRLRPGAWPALVRMSLPMGVAYAFTTLLLRFDIVLLGVMRPAREVGVYGAAAMIVMAIPVIATSLSGSLYPALSRLEGPDDPSFVHLVGRASRVLVIAGACAAAVCVVGARPVVSALYGPSFGATAWALAVLALVLPARFVNTLLGTALNAADRQGVRTAAVGGAALLNLVLNLALIPSLGFRGAVYATLVTEIALSGALATALRPSRSPAAVAEAA